MKLPSGKTVNPRTPIYDGSHFTWGEATKNCSRNCENAYYNSQLLIGTKEIEQNIVKLAKYLDLVRQQLGGHPITINSWYRPPNVNKRVGGASRSRHLFGDAADIVCPYVKPSQVYRTLNKWHGNNGGLGKYYSFTHIDLRGYNARWQG